MTNIKPVLEAAVIFSDYSVAAVWFTTIQDGINRHKLITSTGHFHSTTCVQTAVSIAIRILSLKYVTLK